MYHIGFCIQEIKYHIGYGDVTSTGNIGIANPGKQTTRSAWLATSTLLRKFKTHNMMCFSVLCFLVFISLCSVKYFEFLMIPISWENNVHVDFRLF